MQSGRRIVVDVDLERRGHCFVRYADDCCVYARSRRAGERVMALLRRLYGKLKLTVNEAKSAVAGVGGGASSSATASGSAATVCNAGWRPRLCSPSSSG